MTQASNLAKGGTNFDSSGVLMAAGGGTGTTTFPSPGTSGNVLTSNGTVWTSAAAAAFDAGTVMLFAQTSAPTGWTKNTTTGNNSALRVVTGAASTGGTVAFTTAFASQTPTISITSVSGSAGATTLSTPQIPSHTHGGGVATSGVVGLVFPGSNTRTNTDATGGGGSHTHPFSFSSGSATSSAIDLAVQYIDIIRASKN
jgi:hypothetical protein